MLCLLIPRQGQRRCRAVVFDFREADQDEADYESSAYAQKQWALWLQWQSKQYALRMAGAKYSLNEDEEEAAADVEEKKAARTEEEEGTELAQQVLAAYVPWDDPEEEPEKEHDLDLEW